MIVSIVNPNKFNRSKKNNFVTGIQSHNYKPNSFCKIDNLNFKGNLGYLLFDDIVKIIKKNDIEAVKKIPDFSIINSDLKSLLHISIEENNNDISKILINCGLNINQKDINKNTPFSIACDKKNETLVEMLLKYKPDINTQDKLGNTPLHKAIPNLKILELLLENEADPYIKNDFGLPVLHAASIYPETIDYLLRKGVNPNSINDEEQSLLHIATIDGNKGLAGQLLKYKAEINFKDKSGKTPLFYANNFEMLKYLLSNGANPNILNKKGKTALHEFVAKNNYKNVLELLDYKADPNIIDGDHKPPILYIRNNLVLKLLLTYGADPNIKINGQSILHISVMKNDIDTTRILLNHNADVNILNNDKRTPLFYAKDNEIKKLLLDKGSNTDNNLYLHLALKTDDYDFFNNLLKNDAKTNIEDIHGRTPVFYCKRQNEIIKLLKKKAGINYQDKNGNTPLHYYYATGQLELANFLIENGANKNIKNKRNELPYEMEEKFRNYYCWLK